MLNYILIKQGPTQMHGQESGFTELIVSDGALEPPLGLCRQLC